MAPQFTEADLSRLDELIVKHNADFKKLLRDLLPKNHFATHVVKIMRLCGPLVHFWSMPPERKNKELKDAATSTSSKKNVAITIGIRNQLNMSCLKAKYTYTKNSVEIVPIIASPVDSDVKKICKNACGELNSKKFAHIKILGKKYEIGTVVATEAEDLEPSFGKIINIYEIKGFIYFHVRILQDIEFVTYYFAHRVTDAPLSIQKMN